RPTDGLWASAWYAAAERSTGFSPLAAPVSPETFGPILREILEAARPHYERLAEHKLRP
ncbi:MAG: sulfotransferase-like domain-containing protein, partial [Caulobacteraceae bacterium]